VSHHSRPKTRTETDSLGPIEVPDNAYWGAQTQRSITNFPFPTHERMPLQIIYALAHVKRAAAITHKTSGAIAANIADAIISAADAILQGQHDDQFPLTIWQTGSGTQSNAERACRWWRLVANTR
jgi:fumarate hydratase class II